MRSAGEALEHIDLNVSQTVFARYLNISSKTLHHGTKALATLAARV